jgi:hypothetical protein
MKCRKNIGRGILYWLLLGKTVSQKAGTCLTENACMLEKAAYLGFGCRACLGFE